MSRWTRCWTRRISLLRLPFLAFLVCFSMPFHGFSGVFSVFFFTFLSWSFMALLCPSSAWKGVSGLGAPALQQADCEGAQHAHGRAQGCEGRPGSPVFGRFEAFRGISKAETEGQSGGLAASEAWWWWAASWKRWPTASWRTERPRRLAFRASFSSLWGLEGGLLPFAEASRLLRGGPLSTSQLLPEVARWRDARVLLALRRQQKGCKTSM